MPIFRRVFTQMPMYPFKIKAQVGLISAQATVSSKAKTSIDFALQGCESVRANYKNFLVLQTRTYSARSLRANCVCATGTVLPACALTEMNLVHILLPVYKDAPERHRR